MSSSSSNRPAWKPLIVCPDPGLCAAVRTALEELGYRDYAHLLQYPRPETAGSLVERHQANVVFLDVGSNPETALQLLGMLSGARPMVALNSGHDAEAILRCLRRGAAEFVSDPVTAGQVQEVLERLARSRSSTEPLKLAAVYAVVPGKPGSGASTLAVHLALEFGRRSSGRVLLADFDLLAGTVGFLLKIKSDFHIENAAEDIRRMDQDLWQKLVTRCHGVDVLPAPETPSRADLAPAEAEAILAFCRERYDVMILDTAGAALPATLAVALAADVVLLATTSDMPALYAAARSMARLEAGGLARNRVQAVVNRRRAGGLSEPDLAAALRLDISALLPEDGLPLERALLEGRGAPLDSPFGRGVASLVRRLRGGDEPPPRRPSLLGLLLPHRRTAGSI